MADGVIEACEAHDPCQVAVIWACARSRSTRSSPTSSRKICRTNIKVVCEADGGYDQDVGRGATADCLQAHPDINVLASQADQQTRGRRGLTAAGKTIGLGKDDVKIVSALRHDLRR